MFDDQGHIPPLLTTFAAFRHTGRDALPGRDASRSCATGTMKNTKTFPDSPDFFAFTNGKIQHQIYCSKSSNWDQFGDDVYSQASSGRCNSSRIRPGLLVSYMSPNTWSKVWLTIMHPELQGILLSQAVTICPGIFYIFHVVLHGWDWTIVYLRLSGL